MDNLRYREKRKFFSWILLICLVLISCSPTPAAAPAAEKNPSNVQQAAEKNGGAVQPGAATRTADPLKGMKASQNYELLKGVGILGDSSYDEYQAEDNRGGEYHKITFNMVELLVKHRGFNLGPWGTWGDVRRSGYKYNWARSGSTSGTLIQYGQHTGLAEQIRAGEVTFVYISVGTNDFSPHFMDGYADIYSGKMTNARLEEKINTAIANMTLAVTTVQDAGAKGVMMMTFPQWEFQGSMQQQFPDAAGRKRVHDAIEKINQGLFKMGKEKGIVVLDQNALLKQMLGKVDKDGNLLVGGEKITILNSGDEPHHGIIGDGQHAGTVMSGIFANHYFIQSLKQNFDIDIPPLTDDELLKSAGIR